MEVQISGTESIPPRTPEIKTDVIEGKKIPQEEVEAIAERLGKFYHLPQERIAKAKQAEAYIVNEDEFAHAIKEQLHDDLNWVMHVLETYQAHPDSLEYQLLNLDRKDLQEALEHPDKLEVIITRMAEEESHTNLGRKITRQDGRELVLLKNTISPEKRKAVLKHEILHVLSSSGFEGGTGFSSFDPVLGYKHTALNEGTTEILRLHEQFPHISMINLYLALGKVEQSSLCYGEKASELLGVLVTSHLEGENPFRFEDLARHYFALRTNKMEDKTPDLIRDIQARTEKSKSSVQISIESME